MRIGSLFSGIGGLELGLEWAGVGHTVWQVERDPYAASVLAKHWPDAVRFDDVCTVGAHNLPAVDLICGGFPCQDISVAGKGAGLGGARSGLWSEFVRIAGEIRPRFIVAENVTGLLSIDDGAGFARVLSDLATLGFDAWWDCVPACSLGASHQRDRVFVVAYTNGIGCRDESGGLHPMAVSGRGGEGRSQGDRRGRSSLGAMGRATNGIPTGLDRWPARPGEAQHEWEAPRVAQGVENRAARLKALGNAVVPQVAYVVGRVVMQIAGQDAC